MSEVVKYNPTAPVRDMLVLTKLLDRQAVELAKLLPKERVLRMNRMFQNCVQKNPTILECTQHSVLAKLMHCCEVDLEPGDSRQLCFLVPFKIKGVMTLTFMMGYRGCIEQIMRSGKVSHFYPCQTIYQGDTWSRTEGDRPSLKHVPIRNPSERGSAIAYYSRLLMKNGQPSFCFLWKEEVDEHRAKSRAKDGDAWTYNYDQMGWKTCIHVHSRVLPSMPELARAMSLDVDYGDAIDAPFTASDVGIQPDAIDHTAELRSRLKASKVSAVGAPPTAEKPSEPELQTGVVAADSHVVEDAKNE